MSDKFNIFVCEFITGGGYYGQEIPKALACEGGLMLEAILTDLLDTNINKITITRDSRLPDVDKPVSKIIATENIWQQWQEVMDENACAILIAPEDDHILYKLTKMAEQARCKLLGCSSRAVKVASSKLATYEILSKHSIPCVPTWSIKNNQIQHSSSWIIKPDDSAGATGCYIFDRLDDLKKYIDQLSPDKPHVLQPFVPGKAGSVSLLCNGRQCRVIGCHEQLFEFNQGKGRLKGIIVNGLITHLSEITGLVNQIVKNFPGLWGYVGVDFILTDSGPVILEVNPRLTTSYAGLHKSLQHNPMEWLFTMMQDRRLPELDAVRYSPVQLMLEDL